jgi:hypothetical protein
MHFIAKKIIPPHKHPQSFPLIESGYLSVRKLRLQMTEENDKNATKPFRWIAAKPQTTMMHVLYVGDLKEMKTVQQFYTITKASDISDIKFTYLIYIIHLVYLYMHFEKDPLKWKVNAKCQAVSEPKAL